jgi:hypothetical protein
MTGGFDESLKPAGEDYDFHLRTCAHGPVGFIDASSILYRIGNVDQITAPHLGVHFARSNLRTVLHWLEREGHRIRLPKPLLMRRLAHAFGWAGEAELDVGNRHTARPHLWRSLVLHPWQPRLLVFLLFSMMPTSAVQGARHTVRQTRQVARSLVARVRGTSLLTALLLATNDLIADAMMSTMLGQMA